MPDTIVLLELVIQKVPNLHTKQKRITEIIQTLNTKSVPCLLSLVLIYILQLFLRYLVLLYLFLNITIEVLIIIYHYLFILSFRLLTWFKSFTSYNL